MSARQFSRSLRRPCAPFYSIETLENRRLLSVSVLHNYTGLDFNSSGGYVPPDTNGAAGPTSYVETVNQQVRVFTAKTTNSPSVSASLNTFFFTTGALPHAGTGSGLSDPVVVYDEHIGRFIIGDQDVNFSTHVSRFHIAVSKSSSPASLGTADWKFYSIVTTQSGFDADFPGNMGYNRDAFVFTLNMFGVTSGGHVQVVSINAADLAAAVASPRIFQNNLSDFNVRPSTMHDSVAGDPMWLVTEHGNNTQIDVIKMTGVLSTTPVYGYTTLSVTPYSGVVAPRNPNNTQITNNIDSRIQKAAVSNNTLVATHAVGVSSTQDAVQWYKVNLAGATPTLADQGRVSGGANTYLVYPAIDINAAGNIGLCYMRSGTDTTTDYMSTWVTGRTPGDAAGTMQTPVKSSAGTGVANYTDFSSGHRAGDLSGINLDPVDGSFWAANEFANTQSVANWGTAIVHFNLTSPLASTDMSVTSSGPGAITAGTNVTYTVTLTNNGPASAQGVVLSDLLPAGSTFVSMTKTSGPDTFTFANNGTGTVTQTATGAIASGSVDVFSLVVSAPASLPNGDRFDNRATVTATNPDSNTANNTSTTIGFVSNPNPGTDLRVSVSGPSTLAEGDNVTYTITVTNLGPSTATGVSIIDGFGTLFVYKSATTQQGNFSTGANNAVRFNFGTIAVGATVTATATGQAIEDGNSSNAAIIYSPPSDNNTNNNRSGVIVTISEPPIVVSAPISTSATTLTNFTTATFTHANGVEPTSAFDATIDWGDGTTSAGTITQSGTTYTVKGSHTYTGGASHTVTTIVDEASTAAEKFEETEEDELGRSWKMQDVVRLPGNSSGRLDNGKAGSLATTAADKDKVGSMLLSDTPVLA
jgi:uncharacterized repeat protein (TIGR01451 family)